MTIERRLRITQLVLANILALLGLLAFLVKAALDARGGS
jgi:hypothetical protein